MAVVYRICKKRYPVFDATGSMRIGGRWTSPGVPVLYAAEHYATAVLEQLVHAGRVALPGAHHAASILIPDGTMGERFDYASNPGWDEEGSTIARDFGDAWSQAARTPVLWVPSVPGYPAEFNVLINLRHPGAAAIQPLAAFDVLWDGRLFGPGREQ